MASSDAMQSADVPKSRFEKCISPPAIKQNEAEENFFGAPALEKLERRLSLATVVQRFDDDSRAVRAVLRGRHLGLVEADIRQALQRQSSEVM